MCEEQPYDM